MTAETRLQFAPFLLNEGILTFLNSFDFDYFITANFNRDTTPESGKKNLRYWHRKLDRKLFGEYFWKKKPEDRTFFIAFPEIGSQNGKFHYHMLSKVPSDRRKGFENFASKYWEKQVRGGDLDVRFLRGDIDKQTVKSYTCKDVWRGENYENFLVSTEFSNRQ